MLCCCDKKYLLITVTLPVFDRLLLIELFVLLNCLVFIGLTFFLILLHHINGVMVSVLIWSAVDCGFEHRLGKTKDYKIGICCFSANHKALKCKSKDRLARKLDNASEWSDMFNRILLFQ